MQFQKSEILIAVLFVIIFILTCDASKINKKILKKENKQIFAETKETNTADFVRLLVMRLVYGIAAQFGLEERISGLFNGALIPPNAEDDDYGDFGIDGLLDDY